MFLIIYLQNKLFILGKFKIIFSKTVIALFVRFKSYHKGIIYRTNLIVLYFFAGIEKAEWSPLLLDKLKEMLLNKYVTITVKGINGNVNSVTVEKLNENGSLNVAHKLVMEGLAKSCRAENFSTEHQGTYFHLITS